MAADLQPPAPGPSILPHPTRILVLDDDAVDAELIERCTKGVEGWSASVAAVLSVEAALEATAEEAYDILFVDYYLPRYTGPEAVMELRRAGMDCPAILLTGLGGETILVEAMQAGIVDYIPKESVSPASIYRATSNAIEKSALTREIQSKTLELAQTVVSLECRQREITSFYHNVSHELKTPLTGVREFVSLVLDGVGGELNDSQSDLLSAAVRNCDRMVTCIDDMLDASRIETGKLVMRPKQSELRTVVHDAVDSLRSFATENGIELAVLDSARTMITEFDPGRIYQVVSNLVSNAIKFSAQGSPVTVETHENSEGHFAVLVTDRGKGIDPDDLPLVFDRLYQASEGVSTALGGLGMGLYISKGIAEAHGGDLTVTSKLGHGSTFELTIPRHVGTGPANHQPVEAGNPVLENRATAASTALVDGGESE